MLRVQCLGLQPFELCGMRRLLEACTSSLSTSSAGSITASHLVFLLLCIGIVTSLPL